MQKAQGLNKRSMSNTELQWADEDDDVLSWSYNIVWLYVLNVTNIPAS